MTAERAQAYGRVLQIIEGKGPAGLSPSEAQALREAADTLLFATAADEAMRDARFAAEAIVARLVGSGRWASGEGEKLVEAISACGPESVPVA